MTSVADVCNFLEEFAPARLAEDWDNVGLPTTISLAELADRVKSFLNVTGMHMVGQPELPVTKVAVGCGSAGEFLPEAVQRQCDAMVIGETNFHTCLEAEAQRVGLLLPGHYASERFALEHLAEVLAAQFTATKVWASRNESDPLRWV